VSSAPGKGQKLGATVAVVIGGVVGAGLAVTALLWLLAPVPEENTPVLPAPGAQAVVSGPAAAEPAAVGARAGRPDRTRSLDFPQTAYPSLTSIYDWPREPDAPDSVEERPFTEALVLLCGPHADRAVRSWYAPFLIKAAREMAADPFLLGALMFRMSGCVQQSRGPRVGLTGIAAGLYHDQITQGALHYRAFEDGEWLARSLLLNRFPFETSFLASPESNLYFAAAFLRSWSEQARGLRAVFTQRSEYRHHVSHFIWGDSVQSHREEDWILVDRRRLLEYYGTVRPRPPVVWHGFTLGCPLDGCPRVVTSILGDARAGGARAHAGNDFESNQGEPVRAVADGTVVFAGVDLPGRGAASRIPIWAQRNVDPTEMGAGGLYVCIDHGKSQEGEKLITCYMHLETAQVVFGRTVARGEQIGIVGTSGIKESRPHLHFELHSNAGVHNAGEILKGLAIGNPAPRPADVGAPLSGQGPKEPEDAGSDKKKFTF